MDVSHDIVAANLLLNTGNLESLVSHGEVSPHLLKSLIGNLLNAKLLLGLGKVQPELPPGGSTSAGGEQGEHLLGGIARAQGGLVGVEARHDGGNLVGDSLGDLLTEMS